MNAHRDVVLTIYDVPEKGRRATGVWEKETPVFRKIKEALLIPLVVIRS